MRRLVCFFLISLAAAAKAHAGCTAELQVQEVYVVSEEVVHELYVTDANQLDVDFLIGLVIPKGYAETEAEFKEARARALTEILPLVEKLKRDMLDMESFEKKLARLAEKYDETQDKKDKAAVLYTLVRMFSIPVEYHYINLIADGPYSKDLKSALSRALRKIFRLDTTWIAPLERAMQKAGVSY